MSHPGYLFENPPDRIMGVEKEWTIYDSSKDGDEAYWLPSLGEMYTNPIDGIDSNPKKGFLSSGMRWYKDVNNVAETATPECKGAIELTVYSMACDKFVAKVIGRCAGGAPIRSHLRVAAYTGASKGFHENYYVEGSEDKRVLVAERMVGFLISRMIFNGAGFVDMKDGRPGVMPAQKARSVTHTIGQISTYHDNKPWVIHRDENLNGNLKSRIRFQIAGGDANINPAQSRFTFTTTSSILRLVEKGIDLSHLAPRNVLKATQMVARDPSGTEKIELRGNNGDISSLDLQRRYLDLASKHARLLSDDERRYLETWSGWIDEFQKDRSTLADAIDWINKEKLMAERGITDLKKMQAFDYFYDLVYPVTIVNKKGEERTIIGVGFDQRQNGKCRYNVPPEVVDHALFNPPQSTRARHRGRLVSALHQISKLPEDRLPSPLVTEWDYVVCGEIKVLLFDPTGKLDEESTKNMRLILEMASAARG